MCGVDHYTGQSYEHRRDWVESRLLELAAVFAIDICAYVLLIHKNGSNHLHLVLRIDVELAQLDEAAVLACMAYLDPSLFIDRAIRAKMANTPES